MAEKKSDEGEWRLAGESGDTMAIDDWELVGGLSSGEIRGDSWVWKPGWGEWLRANQVETLRAAVPEAQHEALKSPGTQPLDADPPPLPRASSEAVRHATVPTPIPYTPSPETLPRISHVSEENGGGLFRSPEPTLVDRFEADATETNRTTLKPPGAVPPPPRGVPKPNPVRRRLDTPIPGDADQAHDEESRHADTERDEGPPTSSDDTLVESDPAPTRSTRPSQAKRGRKHERARHEPKSAKPRRLSHRPEQSLDTTLPAASGFAAIERAPTTRRLLWVIAGLGFLCVLLLITIVVLLVNRQGEKSPTPAPALASARRPRAPEVAPSASAPAASAPLSGACELSGKALKLASGVDLSVPVTTLTLDATTLAVGFAQTRTHAVVLKVSWPTLTVDKVFDKQAGPALVGVVPTNAKGELKVATDRVGGPLESPRSLNTEPRITIGNVAAGFGRWTRGQRPRVVWPGSGTQPITVPRVASTAKHGVAVTFRRGGRDGSVVLGWLSQQGAPASDLGVIGKAGELSGTPSVASNDDGVLVTFANRNQKQDPWQVLVGTAALGEVPARAEVLKALAIAEGATAIAPLAAGLPRSRWLLQWTEGASGSYRVRAQTLNQSLDAIGEPLEVSSPEQNAGQGAVWADAERALSLYVVTGASEKELWARSLRCP